MLLWLGRGWREGSAPIISVAIARVVLYAGGTMIGMGGAMIGAGGRMAAAAAAMVVWVLHAVGGWWKESSSSIEQEQKKLKINGELDDLCGYGYGSI